MMGPGLRTAAWLFTLSLLAIGPILLAQSSAEHNPPPASTPRETASPPLQIAVRGCLHHVPNTDKYSIADSMGTTWILLPNGFDLAPHLNHRVLITGKPAADNTPPPTATKPLLRLRVLTVKPIAGTCTP